ncbi:MAG: D-alanyl-D-alanine carboxypeptidase [Acidimicrobiales bacterium]|jgi:D-alanyl-D-alanine carboxypeptidase
MTFTPGISSITGRINSIEQKIAQLEQRGRTNGLEPLGFGMMLDNQVAANAQVTTLGGVFDSAGLTPATQRAPGQYGRLQPPAALVAFGNGQVPAAALEPVGDTGHRLWAPAANGLTRLIANAEAAGVTIGITDSYRPLGVQERLAKEKGLYSQGGLAATPGTSNHGWGLATDLDLDADALAWMRENGQRYGFVEDVPRESWHWTYRPD